jgi:hypothetical protein
MFREHGPYVCNWPTPHRYLVGRDASLGYRLIGRLAGLAALLWAVKR